MYIYPNKYSYNNTTANLYIPSIYSFNIFHQYHSGLDNNIKLKIRIHTYTNQKKKNKVAFKLAMTHQLEQFLFDDWCIDKIQLLLEWLITLTRERSVTKFEDFFHLWLFAYLVQILCNMRICYRTQIFQIVYELWYTKLYGLGD